MSNFFNILRFGHDQGAAVKVITVTKEKAMRVGAFFAGTVILSQSISQLPLILYRKTKDDMRGRADDVPLYDILKNKINRNVTSYEWRTAMMIKLIFHGNALTHIIRNTDNKITALEFLDYQTFKTDGNFYEVVMKNNNYRTFKRDDILHIKYITADGAVGKGIYEHAVEALGFLIATEQYGKDFFINSAIPHIVLIHPGELSSQAEDNIIKSWVKKYRGKKYEPAVLQEGVDIKELKIPNKESQFLELREFEITELARFFRITPHKLQDLKRSTFSNVVELNQSFIIDTLMPNTINIQQAIKRDLLFDEPDLYVEFLFDDLIRGTLLQRYTAYRIAVQNRILTIDEIRRLENRNILTGEEIERNLAQLAKINDSGIQNKIAGNKQPTGRETNEF